MTVELFKQGDLDQFQMSAVHCDPHKPLIILAGPGSGKTTTLCSRICFLVEQCHIETRHVLAITFSNRAANDMRQKLQRAASKWTRGPERLSICNHQNVPRLLFGRFACESDRIDKNTLTVAGCDRPEETHQAVSRKSTATRQEEEQPPEHQVNTETKKIQDRNQDQE